MMSTITLIGMPTAGKSTVGVQLAKVLALNFVDTDLLVQNKVGMSLQQFLDNNGYLALRELEEDILLQTDFSFSVVATGGSAVYSHLAMQRLISLGPCVYLSISYATMLKRLTNAATRGLACQPGTSLGTLYQERLALYEKYSSHQVNCDQLESALVVTAVTNLLTGTKLPRTKL